MITQSQQEPVEKFSDFCLFCRQPGIDNPKHPSYSNPLHTAASRKPERSYVKEFTKKITKGNGISTGRYESDKCL